jgi:hypothetical protein
MQRPVVCRKASLAKVSLQLRSQKWRGLREVKIRDGPVARVLDVDAAGRMNMRIVRGFAISSQHIPCTN